jgi:transcriptional regulator with XRE-family HTH domain
MIISGRQIRGARGLLGWSRDELARKTDLTKITLGNIEFETVQPQEKTLNKIFGIFDKQGIVFTEDDGVKMRKQEIRTYSGKAGFRQFLDHVYETLKDGGIIRQFNFGEGRYLPYEETFVTEYIGRMSAVKNLDAKVLVTSGEENRPLSYCSYRTLDKSFKNMSPWYLYNEFLVLSLNEIGGKREFVSIHSKFLAQRYVDEFDIFWKLSGSDKKKGK